MFIKFSQVRKSIDVMHTVSQYKKRGVCFKHAHPLKIEVIYGMIEKYLHILKYL